MQRKRLLLFFILLIFSVLLMTVQVKVGSFNPFGFISYPLNSLSSVFQKGIAMLKTPLRIIQIATKENEQLSAEIAELKVQLQRFREVTEENERLRALLELKAQQSRSVAAARVVNRGADRWLKTLIIDKGSEEGVQKDMIATSPDGLAGKVIRVWPSYAEILLVTDSSFSVSGRLQNSRVEGIVTGSGSDYCVLNYISNEVDVHEDDILITSGFDRFFPKGIPVGRSRSVKKTTPELFQYIELLPFVDISRIEEVSIISQ